MNLGHITKSVARLGRLASFCGLGDSFESAAASAAVKELAAGTSNLAEYLSYRYWDEEQQLFFNDSNVTGFVLEIAPIVGVDEGLHKNLQHFFNDELPAGSYLQVLLVADHEVSGILKHWQAARASSNPFLNKITERRKNFILNEAINFGSSDGRLARNYRAFVSFSRLIEVRGSDHSKEAVAAVASFKSQLLSKLESLNLAPHIVDATGLIALVKTMLQMELAVKGGAGYRNYELLSKQILDPSHINEVTEDEIRHKATDLVSRCYHLAALPPEFSLAAGINLLGDSARGSMGINGRFIISYTIASDINASKAGAITTRGKRVIDAAEKWYSRNDRNIKREASQWQEVNDRVINGERLLTEHWQLMVTANSGAIEVVEQSLINLYNVNNFRLEVTRNLQLPVLLAMLPMQQPLMWWMLKNFRLTRLVLAKEVIARLPIHAEWKGVPKSGVLLHGRRGQLFNFNPFYRISSGNYNICIFAPSGGGKSVLLQELAVSMMAQNTRVFVLDIGQSFANVCTLVAGEIIQFGRERLVSLNPFAAFRGDMNPDDREELLKCAKALMEVMCGAKDNARGSAELEKAIVAALKSSNYQLDISSFARFLEESSSVILQQYGATLYPYTREGIYGKYFSGSKIASFRELMTIFEFEEIKNDPKLFSIVLQILLMEVSNQFLTGDRTTPFMIIVDEAWMLLDFAAAFFAAYGRTVRKYGGSLVVCVQNFMDLQKSADHRAILENSTWTILLKQDEKGLGAFRQSEAFKDMLPLIRSISLVPNKYAEMLICATGVSVVGRLVLDDYSSSLYSTNAEDFAFIKAKRAQGVGLDQAIEQLVIKKRG